MKYLLALVVIFIGIVLGVSWFVNNGLEGSIEFLDSTKEYKESGPEWRFAVIGDTEGLKPVTQRMVESLKAEDVEFIVHLGDIGGKPDRYTITTVMEAFDELPFPVYYIPGNNELVYDNALQRKTTALYEEVVNEKLWYAFDHENTHFVMLDNSYMRTGFHEEELEWLQQDLGRNDAEYTFLFYHRPVAVPGEQFFGDDETEYSRGQNEKFRALISRYEIERIFNGHLHFSLAYTLDGIPVTVSGGGGGLPQQILGGDDAANYHYIIVHVPLDGGDPELEMVSFE